MSAQPIRAAFESRYGDDVLHLVVASAYAAKGDRQRGDRRYLQKHHPELLTELHRVGASIDQADAV